MTVESKNYLPVIGVAPDRRGWVFAAALSTIFMAAIEGTIVATAMPTIVGALGGLEHFSWVFSAYLLTQAIMIPIYGRLADMYGRKRVLHFGIGVFLTGSLLCGFAWSMTSLIVFRVVQGVGAGALVPVGQTVVGDIYSGEQRARMQGYVSSTFGCAAVIGPIIGSFLVTHFDWSLIFWVNIPLGIIAGVMLEVALTDNNRKRPHRIDIVGSVLMALTTATLMFALVQAAVLNKVVIMGLIVVSALLLTVFLAYERRVPEPMLPVKLFGNRIVAGGNAVGLANGAIMMSIVGFLPAYMQGVMGASATLAGAALAAMSVAWPFGGFVGSRMMLWSTYRVAATIGGVVLVAGSLLMIAVNPALSPAWPITAALLMGFGMGVTNICFVVAIQANVDWAQRGIATSSVMFTRIIGQSLGSAVFGGILNIGLSGHPGGANDIIVRMMQPGMQRTPELTGMERLMDALSRSLHNIYQLSGLLALAVLTAILFLPLGLKLVQRKEDR